MSAFHQFASASEMTALGPPPRVSLGLPVYNGERYLVETLDAILAQTWDDFELIIVDNASTDATPAIANRYVAADPRVRYYRHATNIGAAPNFNRAFALSRGTYFKWCAHDDRFTPDYLARSVAVLDAQPDVVLCCSQVAIINESGRVIGAYRVQLPELTDPRPHRRFGAFITRSPACFQVFGLFRRDVLAATPLIGSFLGADKALVAEICLRGRVYEIPEPLFFSRQHARRSVKLARPQLIGWFDTSRRGHRVLPHWQLLRAYAEAVRRVPLSPAERRRCRAWLWLWAGQHGARLLFDPIGAVAPGLWDALWRLDQRLFRPRGYSPRYFHYDEADPPPS